ncbi:partial 4-alpha-glucanotransferase, partial [uncultured bacterium]
GMEAFWEIPGDAPTAETGKWVKAPGAEVLSAVMNHLGPIDIIAEDLGIITDEVVALREQFNLPGMKILQFAFGTGMEKKFLPHNFVQNCAVYTGSHDNDTTRGYFEKEKNNPGNDIYEFTQKYLNYYGEDVTGELIRTAYASVANTVVVPMQDILRLGSEARMNFPGKLGGNWTWRFTWDQLTEEHVHTLSAFVQLYDRKPEKKEK